MLDVALPCPFYRLPLGGVNTDDFIFFDRRIVFGRESVDCFESLDRCFRCEPSSSRRQSGCFDRCREPYLKSSVKHMLVFNSTGSEGRLNSLYSCVIIPP